MNMKVLLLVAAAGLTVGACNRDRDDDRYNTNTTYRSDKSSTDWNRNNARTTTNTPIRPDYRDNTAMQPAATPSYTPPVSAPQTTTQLRAADTDFITQASTSGMKEVEFGRLGVRQSSDDRVKAFAQKVIDDHSKANDELTTLARTKNVTIESQMPQDHKDMVTKFNQLNGADFDRQFIDHMVQSHQKSVDLFDRQARQGDDAEVRAFAARTLPTLRQHLQMAKDLQTQLGAIDLGTPTQPPAPVTPPFDPNNPR